jgi:hypothetical protein
LSSKSDLWGFCILSSRGNPRDGRKHRWWDTVFPQGTQRVGTGPQEDTKPHRCSDPSCEKGVEHAWNLHMSSHVLYTIYKWCVIPITLSKVIM